jgi:outer membrane usher protein
MHDHPAWWRLSPFLGAGLLLLHAAPAGAALRVPSAEPAPVLMAQLRDPAPGGSMDEPLAPHLVPLEITINDAPTGNYVLLERAGILYATEDILAEWRLIRPTTGQPFAFRGQSWFALTSIPGYRVELRPADQGASLRFAPEAFAATRLVQETTKRPTLTPMIPSVFANYDLSYTRTSTKYGLTATDAGALMELGTSGNWGLLTTTALGRNLLTSDPVNAPRRFLRLETTYTRDFPDARLTLRVGDTTTHPASWGRTVYFGGLQIGRNFGLTPGFISQPLPVLSGVSATPSTVELYINDALRQTSHVPAGPFAINNFPMLTGSGEARMVVRDVLGRETVIVQDFFIHPSMLEQGLTDWSFEAGAVRNQLGVKSSDYGPLFAGGLWRHGFTKNLTFESRGELGRRTQGLGIGASAGLPFELLGQLAGAASRNEAVGAGYLWQASLAHSQRRHGFTVNVQGATPSYRQIGQEDASPSYRMQLSASYTYQHPTLGALGLGFATIDSPERGRIMTYSANYSMSLWHGSVLTLSAVRVVDPSHTGTGTSLGVNVFVPLDNNRSMSANVNHRAGATDGFVTASQGITGDTGIGWRVLAGHRQDEPEYAEGGIYLQRTDSLSTVDVSASPNQQTIRLGLQGGVVWADRQVFRSRRITDSFAVVEVPGYAGVGVSVHGNVVAHTDAQGRALVPRLLPYQANDIRLDPSELPMSAELDTIEMRVVPGPRSAVKTVFPVRVGRGALVRIVLDDGAPAPAGAELEIMGDKEEFFVARRGEAFLTGLKDRNEVKLKWNDQTCTFTVVLPPGDPEQIPKLEPVKCPGLKR